MIAARDGARPSRNSSLTPTAPAKSMRPSSKTSSIWARVAVLTTRRTPDWARSSSIENTSPSEITARSPVSA